MCSCTKKCISNKAVKVWNIEKDENSNIVTLQVSRTILNSKTLFYSYIMYVNLAQTFLSNILDTSIIDFYRIIEDNFFVVIFMESTRKRSIISVPQAEKHSPPL